MSRSILVAEGGATKDNGFLYICSGYLVEDARVLLVHHNGFDKWVPPGGHIEFGETFSQTATREFLEETGLTVRAISASMEIDPKDGNAIPEPVPFYVDVEYNSFTKPALVQFFYVERDKSGRQVEEAQLSEIKQLGWFSMEELETISTFDQVRSLARHALMHYPVR
ncbi:NUDIX domain-containing protein [Umezawaea tangerina]|uniref:NUDIX domain-containing protein n=1 Tax=Umezawaea tangerina TaxID=84725 RepID=UPI000D06DA56|nr:NUDIX hydrolase [Umezawaea tangerina]